MPAIKEVYSTGTLQDAVQDLLSKSQDRVSGVEFDGSRYWVKQPEAFSPWLSLTKGSPKRAFEAERNSLKHLNSLNVPVPPIALEGDNFFVLEDRGTPIAKLLRGSNVSAETRTQLLNQAGQALADLHCGGVSHGRPYLKDLAWDGHQVTFLDFENFNPKACSDRDFARDFLLFIFSAHIRMGGPTNEIRQAANTYLKSAPTGVWPEVIAWTRRIQWLRYVAKPLSRVIGGRELKAFPTVLDEVERKFALTA